MIPLANTALAFSPPEHSSGFFFKIARISIASMTLSPRPFPFMGKGAALEDMPPSRLWEWHSRGRP